MRKPYQTVALLVVVWLACTGFSNSDEAAENLREVIDSEVEISVTRLSIPSVSVGVIRNGEVFHYSSMGNTQNQNDFPVDKRSLYQIASLSKMFTGIISNSLIREGQLDPTISITNYLSPVLSEQAADRLESVTLLSLLNHRSGILDPACSVYKSRQDGEPWLKGYSKSNLIADLNSLFPAKQRPKQFHYSNCGYVIAALICELVSNNDYQTLLKKYVNKTYRLPNTVVQLNDQQRKLQVVPYGKADRKIATQASVMGMATPASGLYSNVEDLVSIQQIQLEAYRDFIRNQESSALVLTERTSTGPEDSIQYGFGLMEIDLPAGTLYGHDGDADGYASFYSFSPEFNIGLVVLTGSGGSWVKDLSMSIINALIDAADDQ